MPEPRPVRSALSAHPWPLVLGLVGVDYFSTLAYLPSIAAEAAGVWAPITAFGVVLVTFLLALPVYWYVVGRAPDGRGATGILEDLIPGWRGKLVVLALLGFAAADFVITRSLSLADATIHLMHNPHGQQILAHLPDQFFTRDHGLWPPFEFVLRRLGDRQVIITLILSVISFAFWQLLKRGVSRRVLLVTAVAVSAYLILTGIIITSGLFYLASHAEIWRQWKESVFAAGQPNGTSAAAGAAWLWSALQVGLRAFPQMALGLSGFELIMTVAPRISATGTDEANATANRVHNTRKLMIAAASLMAGYLVASIIVTTLLIPCHQIMPGGAATHRALAYLAHGSPLANGASSRALNPLFGEGFGDLFDLSSAFILCLAGLSVTLGLLNLVPHYLNRLGMDGHWAGQYSVIMHIFNVIILVVTVVFRASPSLQQWAYATSVLVLLAGAALAASKDLRRNASSGLARGSMLTVALTAAVFFLSMTGLTVLINPSGLVIALSFVVAIVVSSFVSRWIRCTELRFEGLEFADDRTRERWNELCQSNGRVLVPHRPGLVSLTERRRLLDRDYRLDPTHPPLFVEVELGDPSNFYQKPLMRIDAEEGLEVIRVSRCVSVSHVLASLCLELCSDNHAPPEIIFGWSHESPIAANLNFLLLGEGNIPWMVKELVRKAIPDPARQPRIRIG